MRREIATDLAEGRFGLGRDKCAHEVATEGRIGSYPASFDEWLTETGGLRDDLWPSVLDFNLSNRCNLQCIQCNGNQSSAIRIHREHRPPLAPAYSESFFEDVLPFLEHAEQATFAGGEPFLASENFRLWDAMRRLDHPPRCKVITNGTIWNDRVRDAVASLDMEIVVSVDGATDATFELVRQRADHRVVMRNIGRLRDMASAMSINHCLMVQNHQEFGDLLLFAERLDLPVNVSVVRWPPACSIVHQSHDQIVEIAELLQAEDARVRPELDLNRGTWVRELTRLRTWANSDAEQLSTLRGVTEVTILGFKRSNGRPRADHPPAAHDPTEDVGLLLEIVVRSDDRVHAVNVLRGATPTDSTSLVGTSVAELPQAISNVLGAIGDMAVEVEVEDLTTMRATFGGRQARIEIFPNRDDEGVAATASILISIDDAL